MARTQGPRFYTLLERQLEAIMSGGAKASEVLGGYVLTRSGRTVGDMIEERSGELMPGERLMLSRPTEDR